METYELYPRENITHIKSIQKNIKDIDKKTPDEIISEQFSNKKITTNPTWFKNFKKVTKSNEIKRLKKIKHKHETLNKFFLCKDDNYADNYALNVDYFLKQGYDMESYINFIKNSDFSEISKWDEMLMRYIDNPHQLSLLSETDFKYLLNGEYYKMSEYMIRNEKISKEWLNKLGYYTTEDFFKAVEKAAKKYNNLESKDEVQHVIPVEVYGMALNGLSNAVFNKCNKTSNKYKSPKQIKKKFKYYFSPEFNIKVDNMAKDYYGLAENRNRIIAQRKRMFSPNNNSDFLKYVECFDGEDREKLNKALELIKETEFNINTPV